MTQEEFDYLREGSIIQHKGTGEAHVILHRYFRNGKYEYEAVRAVEVTNPDEWEVVRK